MGFQRPQPILQERFAALGWCPKEHRMVSELLRREDIGLFVASRLNRPFSATHSSHVSCTSERCRASRIKPGPYEPKHTVSCAEPDTCRTMVLGLDVGRIFEHNTVSKWTHAWYSMLHEHPKDILFLNIPSRLTVPGYLWAPVSFPSHGKSLSAINKDPKLSRTGAVTQRGNDRTTEFAHRLCATIKHAKTLFQITENILLSSTSYS